jgi:uncharacterized membrane protein YsdA (DUF1294 family)
MLPDIKIEIMISILIVWNIIVFAMYGVDKQKAKRNSRRISEKTLILSAVFMGGTGALLGMQIFRHKTKHLKFKIGIPLLLILNIAIFCVYLYFK